jgi:dihydroorotase
MLILKNTKFVGVPEQYISPGMDIKIDEDGIITKISTAIEPKSQDMVLDLSKSYISPGWIDLHTHIYYGVSNLALHPTWIGPKTGVSVLVDAGSAGESTFLGFSEYIAKQNDFPIYAFLNVGSTGLIGANDISEMDTLEKVNIEAIIECVNRNRDIIKGIKVRASGVIFRTLGQDVVKLSKEIAREVGLPLMVHVGEPMPLLKDILPILEDGDILTHCYHGKRWGILENGRVIPEAKEAMARGVLFDVGHGEASFNFGVAKQAIDLGYKPFSISTDLHQRNLRGPVIDLATTMSKLLGLGLSLNEVIACVTTAPAKVLGIEDYSQGLTGKKARFTVFQLKDHRISMQDSNGNTKAFEKVFEPSLVILKSNVIEAKTELFSHMEAWA